MQLCYLLTGLKASILLAMGGWDKDQPQTYWRERFMVPIPEQLITLLLPCYNDLQAKVKQADAANTRVHFSARGLLKLLPYLAYVAVQDALELCGPDHGTKYHTNPVHKLLLSNDIFR